MRRASSAPRVIPDDRHAAWVAAAVLLATLALAYLGKAVCIDAELGFWGATRYCYSDVRVLWSFRGYDVDAVPYRPPPPGYVEDYTTEYPPGIALPAYAIAVATDSRRAFFNVNAVTFAVAALLALRQLDRTLVVTGRNRWRQLGFALSPSLVLFGMLNWDLWAVALVAFGLHAAARRAPYQAAMWFGLGAATKWWPALLVVLLMVGPWRSPPRTDDRAGGAWRPALVAAATWLAVQLPAIALSPSGWWASVLFHLRRAPNLDSLPSAAAAAGRVLAPGRFWDGPFTTAYTVASLAVLVAGIALVAWRLRRGGLHPGDAALALVALLLLTGKVFSPQFVLWLLPVAVVATVPWTPVLAVEAANVAVWLLFGPWMAHLDDLSFAGFLTAARALTVVRALTVLWLVVVALLPRQEQADEHERGAGDEREQTSHAVTGVQRQ